MTTEKREEQQEPVSAEEQQIADQVSEAQTEEEGAAGQEPSRSATLEDLERVAGNIQGNLTNSLQGRMANWNSQQFKQFKEELRQEFGELMGPIRNLQQRSELAQEAQRVGQLPEEEQIRHWQGKVWELSQGGQGETPKPSPEQTGTEQQSGGLAISEQDRQRLAASTSGLLIGKGLDDSSLGDNRLWEGAHSGMTADQLFQVARGNVDKLVPKQAATKPTRSRPQTPPSTQGVNGTQTRTYSSKADLAKAFTERHIDVDTYREELKKL